MPDATATNSTPSVAASPDYVGLVNFLLKPFLESPDSLKVDCEMSPRKARVLLRLAFDGEDKGRVFGRGGRNIQAIRTVLQAIAQTAGYSLHMEVFGSHTPTRESGGREGNSEKRSAGPPKAPSRRPRPHS